MLTVLDSLFSLELLYWRDTFTLWIFETACRLGIPSTDGCIQATVESYLTAKLFLISEMMATSRLPPTPDRRCSP
jgi:hypothetical protein